MSDVFISYSRKDIAFARLLRESLQQNQIDTWIDWERIPVGEKWWVEICQAIESANVFMFIISRHSIGSPVCKDEINHALKNNKRIIPIILDELTPAAVREFVPELPQFNWIIFEKDHLFQISENPEIHSDRPEDSQVALPKQPQFVEALEKLSQAIHTDWEWVKYHTRLQVNALLWESNGRDPGYLVHGTALEESEQQLLRASGKQPVPTELQVEYVSTSRKEETLRQQEKLKLEQKARARQRLVIWAVGIGLGLAVLLGGLAWTQRNQAVSASNSRATAEANAVGEAHNRATAEAHAVGEANSRATAEANAVEQRDVAVVRQLAAQARNLSTGHFDEALLLALEADRRLDISDARSSLLYVTDSQPHLTRYLPQHGWGWGAVAYSPDGKLLAVGTVDASVLLLDAGSGEPVTEPFTGVTAEVLSLAFSPDGHSLFAGDNNGVVVGWDISQPEKPVQKAMYPVGVNNEALMMVMASGLRPLQVGNYASTPYLWNVAASQQVNISYRAITSLAVSPDGDTLAAGMGSGGVAFLGLSNGENIKALAPPPQRGSDSDSQMVLDLSFTPAGDKIIYSTAYGTIRIGDWLNQELYSAPRLKLTPVISRQALSPDGKILAYASDNDGSVWLMDMETSDVQRYPLLNSEKITSLAYDPDGTRLALGLANNTIEFWDTQTHQVVGAPLNGHHGEVMALAFSPDGRRLASMDWEHSLITWDLQADERLLTTFVRPSLGLSGMDISSDGRLLAAFEQKDYKNNLTVWDLKSNPPVNHLITQEELGVSPVEDYLDFLPKSHTVVFYGFTEGVSNSVILFWDLDGNKAVQKIDQSNAPLALSPDGRWLAAIKHTGKQDQKDQIAIWDVSTGKIAHELEISDIGNNVNLAFSPDNRLLATGFDNGDIRLWKVDTGEEAGNVLSGHHDMVTDLKFSPDGKNLASGSADKSVRIWDMSQPDRPSIELPGNNAWIDGVAYSPDGRMLVSTSPDGGTIQVWDTQSHLNLGQLTSSKWDITLNPVFSADGAYLFVAGLKYGEIIEDTLLEDQGTISQWQISPLRWGQTACSVANRNFSLTEWQSFFGGEAYRKTCADQTLHPSIVEKFLQMEQATIRLNGTQAALAKFATDLPLDPGLTGELETSLKTFPVIEIAFGTFSKTPAGIIDPSVEMYQAFKTLGIEKNINAQAWNMVCWYGTLWGKAKDVVDICELAVSLDPTNGAIRDSRGLALALTGNTDKAVQDFQAFIDYAGDSKNAAEDVKLRREWIAALKKGQNPFDEALLKSLRSQ